jgi:uncharacterized protein
MKAKSNQPFSRIMEAVAAMPVIDCHEHLGGPERDLAAVREPIAFIIHMYLVSDLWSAGATDAEIAQLQDGRIATADKWDLFSRLWRKCEHTAYARVTKRMLKESFGIERLSLAALERLGIALHARTAEDYLSVLSNCGVRAVIADMLFPPPAEKSVRYYGNPVLRDFLKGGINLPPDWRPVLNLPYFHELRFRDFIDSVESMSKVCITSLNNYEEAMHAIIAKARECGVVALKDQSAYRRPIDYTSPTCHEAELLFNRLLSDPRNQLAWPDARPLDDYLFQRFMEFAREFDLPVQVHTGHMAGMRNRVDKAEAGLFAPVLERHRQVRFDLFHGNWPNMGGLLFLAKNYPNAAINLCWVTMIDPLYSIDLLKRAVMSVPHSKIHLFGGDFFHVPELAAAHLGLAREVAATALADLVEHGWLAEEDALVLAKDWLFNNPNGFYRLGA